MRFYHLALPLLMLAGDAAAQATPTLPPCTGTEQRQFDFWVGHWVVHDPRDEANILGNSRIERAPHGCWIQEHWTSSAGNYGSSLNAWDAPHGVWRQFWVGADGGVLRLEGRFEQGEMRLEGELPTASGGRQRQRVTWAPRPDGSVTQHWQTSEDDGQHWQTSFFGVYRRKAGN